jgi:ParB family chromosome partitioning protein
MGHARALLTAPDDDQRLALWEKVRADGLSVRRTESLVKEMVKTASRPKKEPTPEQNGLPLPDVSREFDSMLGEITARLRQVLGTQVKIKASGAGEGAIQIDFYSSEDLERLLELFAIIERQQH